MKYIVMEVDGKELIFTFPRYVDHDRMLEGIQAVRLGPNMCWTRKFREGEAIAAGFVEGGRCIGHSETLGLKSRGDADTALLRKAL